MFDLLQIDAGEKLIKDICANHDIIRGRQTYGSEDVEHIKNKNKGDINSTGSKGYSKIKQQTYWQGMGIA